MATEPKLLVSIINTQNTQDFVKIDRGIFKTEQGLEGYNFINSYLKEYSSLPPLEVFKEKFPNYPYSTDYNNPTFFYQEILNHNSRIELSRVLQEVSVAFNNKEPIENITSKLRNQINNLSYKKNIEKVVDIRDNIEKRYDDLLTRQSIEKKENLYTLGHPYLDKLGIVDKASFNIILARYGVGKSWLGLYLAYKYWKKGLNPLFISIEMPTRQVEERLDSILSGISYSRFVEGSLYQDEIEKFKQYVRDMKENTNPCRLNISAPSKCTVDTVRELALEYKAGVVFVDYVQLMKDVNNAREKRIALGNIGNDTKALAKELEIPIFYVAQANRTAVDEIPRGEHVKDCDELAAAADMILSLYQTKDLKEARKMELHITKFRNGTEGHVTSDWCFQTMNFLDIKHPFGTDDLC